MYLYVYMCIWHILMTVSATVALFYILSLSLYISVLYARPSSKYISYRCANAWGLRCRRVYTGAPPPSAKLLWSFAESLYTSWKKKNLSTVDIYVHICISNDYIYLKLKCNKIKRKKKKKRQRGGDRKKMGTKQKRDCQSPNIHLIGIHNVR